MVNRECRYLSFIILLLMGFIIPLKSLASIPNHDSPEKCSIAIAYPFLGVTVFDGKGKLLAQYLPKKDKKEKVGSEKYWGFSIGYLSPQVVNDQEIIMLKCSNIHYGTNSYYNASGYEIVLASTASNKEIKTIYGPVSSAMDSPVLSPDGRYLAFLENTVLKVFDIQYQYIKSEKEILTRPINPIGDRFENYIRWSESGCLLYLNLIYNCNRVSSCDYIGEYNLDTSTFTTYGSEWGCPYMKDTGLYSTKVVANSDESKKAYLVPWPPETEATRKLFGSKEQPVHSPIRSICDNMYYYTNSKPGMFSSYWLESYNNDTHETKTIKIIDRGLYAE